MPSSFFGLNIAVSGLMAQQTSLNVLGHNIANANNPAYKRQLAVMSARSAYPNPGGPASPFAGQLGAGTDVVTIRRMQDNFIDGQMRDSTQGLGKWQASKQSLDQIVSILGEPSATGLSSDFDQFWNSWQKLSLDPQNTAGRNEILELGDSVARSLNGLANDVEAVGNSLDMTIRSKVDGINTLARQLASVNDQIQRVRGAGDAPNDLLDQRDDILGQLSQIAGVQVLGDGGVSDVVTLGGRTLVQGSRSTELKAGSDASGHVSVQWADDGEEAVITGGEVGGMLDVLRTKIPSYLDALNGIASGLIGAVNTLHASGTGLDGSTELDFFQGTGARDIHVNADLRADPKKIAASGNGAVGDGTVALAISKIKSQALVNGATISEAYRSLVSRNAMDASGADHHVEAQSKLNDQILLQQQSVSGVSLDEEMTDMIRFQQAYNASARVINVMDEMLSTIVDRLGVGGR